LPRKRKNSEKKKLEAPMPRIDEPSSSKFDESEKEEYITENGTMLSYRNGPSINNI